MNFTKWICLALCLIFVFSLAGCKRNKTQPDDLVQTLPPIETAVQKDYTSEEIIAMYNAARDKIVASDSYHMHGSSNSTSLYGSELSSVVNSYDVKAKNTNGTTVGFFDSQTLADGSDFSHTTYFDGEFYYYTYSDLKYYKDTNDFQDFFAQDWLMPLGNVELQELDVMDQLDGSVDISFAVPMGDYMSDAVLTLVGFTSETFEEDLVYISCNIDGNGVMTYFYISYNSAHVMWDEKVEQTVIVSMSLDGYDASTVEVPADLSAYDNFIDEGADEDFGGVGILSPEDVE